MAVNFPSSPYIGQIYTYDGRSWEWNGTYWESYTFPSSGLTGATSVGVGDSVISGIVDNILELKSFSGDGITITDDGDTLTFSAATLPGTLVTSVSGGTGLSGNSTTGAIVLVNTAPDQTVTISGGTGITTGGTYPNFTLVNSAPDQTVTITGGTNIQIAGTYPNFGVDFTGQTSFPYLPLSGGTVTGNTTFTSGLTATTVSATTYENLPQSVSGTGTQDYLTKWDPSLVGIVDSTIYDDGIFVGFNTSSPIYNESVSIQTGNKGILIDDAYVIQTGNGSLAFAGTHDYSSWGGSGEIAIGSRGPLSNSTGSGNIGIGDKALLQNITGNNNIGIGGTQALGSNVGGNSNIGIGNESLLINSEGSYNISIGESSLRNNTSGSTNIAIGTNAGYSNLNDNGNVYIGDSAGYSNVGGNNIFIGYGAGSGDTSSSDRLNIGDTIFGDLSSKFIGINVPLPSYNLHLSGNTNVTGTKGSIITDGSTTGAFLTFSGSNTVGGTGYTDFIKVVNTAAGASRRSKTIRVNNTGSVEIINDAYTTNILSLTDAGVLFTPGGGTSDIRTKKNIEYIQNDFSDLILKLKPAKFEFKNNEGIKRHGFIAQDIMEFYPDLVLGDGYLENGTYGLDYDGILSLTVKSLQESMLKIQQLEKRIVELESK